jgi:hypothetical protein
MKKLKIIITLTLLILSISIPFGSAFASNINVLNGITAYSSDFDGVFTGGTAYSNLTDNDYKGTSTTIPTSGKSIYFTLPSTKNITRIDVTGRMGTMFVRTYDSNKTLISGTLVQLGTSSLNYPITKTVSINTTGVKYIEIRNGDSTYQVVLTEVEAYESYVETDPDLLIGKPINRALDHLTNNVTSTSSTDNNDNTATTIGVDGSTTDTFWYQFPTAVSSISSYRIFSTTANSTGLDLVFYDTNGVVINRLNNISANGIKTGFTSVSDVKKVALINSSNPSTISINTWSLYSGGGIPPVPVVKTNVTNVDIKGITTNTANVTWSNPTDYSGVTYSGAKIYVDGELKHTPNPLSTSYSLTNLTPSASYTVRVVASWSDETESTGITKVFNTLEPPDTTAPGNVTNLVATPTFNSISLSWTNPTDQDFAKVNVYEDGIYKKSVTATEGSSAFFGSLDPDTIYSFKVTSVDFTGNESSGAEIEVKTLPLPEVKKIQNLSATTKFDRVKLSWTLPESEHFHHVNIYRKVVEEKSFFESLFSLGEITVSAADTEDGYKPMFETNGTYWTDLTVEPETEYQYKLTSENVDGRESTDGVVVQVSTPEEPKPILKDAQFQAETNGDYVVKWSEPTTGNVKIKVGGKDYKTVPANLKTYTIPKSDLAYTTVGDPDVTIQPVTERGTEGDAVSSPKMNLPFSAKDLVESGNGLLWLVGPFILLALAFLLVPKFRELILAAFRGKGKLIDTGERRSTTGDKELNLEPKGKTVRLTKEPRESRAPRMKADRAEREVRTGREPRQSIRESRAPRVSRRGR